VSYYRTCDQCGANLDPDERCDCGVKPSLDREFARNATMRLQLHSQRADLEHEWRLAEQQFMTNMADIKYRIRALEREEMTLITRYTNQQKGRKAHV